MKYTNHSGGAKGSDSVWDYFGRVYGIDDHRHYWHPGLQKPPLGNVEITDEQLEEGWKRVLLANKTLNRRPEKYKSLLARNWFQVKDSEAVFAIGTIADNSTEVNGGTGWAVQMAIDSDTDVYVFDQEKKQWYVWMEGFPGEPGKFATCSTPTLTQNFAGIGTRNINKDGIEAIKEVYRKTLEGK